ncbi:fdxB, ferredoxin [Actinobacteria bacterium OK074]|nr:fdxB, ferredoxin [Actinobacteria bacterium OK074]
MVSVRITVDRERCCGAGNCVINAPEVFDQDDTDGLVLLLVARPAEELEESVELAALQCPAGAIGVVRRTAAR